MATDGILITGGTGFVGRHVVAHLRAARHRLKLAVRSISACPREWREAPDLHIAETGNLEAATNLDDIFRNVTKVIHLAGLAHLNHVTPDTESDLMHANVEATARLVSAAGRHGIRSFIHLGSIASISDNNASNVINDETCDEPSTPYGRTKRLAEQSVLSLAASGTLAVTLRPPLIVGADAGGNWASLQRLASTGLPLPFATVRNRRSLASVDTIAASIVHLCRGNWSADRSGNYCIADPEALSLAEIVSEIRAGMGLPARLVPCPPSLLYAAARGLNQRRRAAGLLGTLEIDASRFGRTFGFTSFGEPRRFVRQSGADYRRLREKENAIKRGQLPQCNASQ